MPFYLSQHNIPKLDDRALREFTAALKADEIVECWLTVGEPFEGKLCSQWRAPDIDKLTAFFARHNLEPLWVMEAEHVYRWYCAPEK